MNNEEKRDQIDKAGKLIEALKKWNAERIGIDHSIDQIQRTNETSRGSGIKYSIEHRQVNSGNEKTIKITVDRAFAAPMALAILSVRRSELDSLITECDASLKRLVSSACEENEP